MKEDLRTAVRDAVAPALEVGEHVEIEAFGGVGQVSVKRMVATTVVVSALTLGTVMAVAKPRALFMVLTDRRLIFLEPSAMAGKPTSTIVFVLPREACPRNPAHPRPGPWHRRVREGPSAPVRLGPNRRRSAGRGARHLLRMVAGDGDANDASPSPAPM